MSAHEVEEVEIFTRALVAKKLVAQRKHTSLVEMRKVDVNPSRNIIDSVQGHHLILA